MGNLQFLKSQFADSYSRGMEPAAGAEPATSDYKFAPSQDLGISMYSLG